MTTPMKQSIILRMNMENSKRTEKLRQQYRNILRRFSNAGNYDGYFIGKVSLEFNMAADAGKMNENRAHIIKSRENYAELAASGDFADGYLSIHMYLMKPVSKAAAQNNSGDQNKYDDQNKSKCSSQYKSGSKYKFGSQNKSDVANEYTPNMVFSKDEILSFVSDTGDFNPIHQGEHPVVPGLLILEKLILEKLILEKTIMEKLNLQKLNLQTDIGQIGIFDFMRSFGIRFRTPLYADEPVRLVPHKASGRMDGYRGSDGVELFSCKY